MGCYTFSVVEYANLGRKLGVGTRIAAKLLRERGQNHLSPASRPGGKGTERVHPSLSSTPTGVRPPARAATRKVSRGVVAGGRGFGRGFWNPFRQAARSLWHEITGVFFGIFALFFAQNVWRVRNAWRVGPEHRHFAVYLVFLLIFAYFSATAFGNSRRSPQ